MNKHTLRHPRGWRRATARFARATLATLLITGAASTVISIASVYTEDAGAQGALVIGSTVRTSEAWEGYCGWGFPSWQICTGGSAGFRADVRLDYPAYVRAGQSFQYRRCVYNVEFIESGSYEVGLNGIQLDGDYQGVGTQYEQWNWHGVGTSVCKNYSGTAPSTPGANQTINIPSAGVRGNMAAGYAGSCCGNFALRGTAYSNNNSFVTNVLVNPAAVNDTAVVAQGGSVAVNVTANDIGFSGPNSGTPTGMVIAANGTKGTCVASGTTVWYIHSGGATGTDSCVYTLNQAQTDDMAPSDSTVSATVTFTISGPPVAGDDAKTTTEDAPLTFDPRTNDVDPESGALTITGINASGLQGAATFTGTSLTYNPGTVFQYLQAGQSATTKFKYTIADPAGLTDEAEVTMTVTGVNDAPVAVADAITTGENGPAIAYDVRLNDTDVDTGDTRTVTAVNTTGTMGTVTFTPTGVTYTPAGFDSLNAGQTGTDTFAYTVTDSQGATATATVTVTIVGANDAPVASADTMSVGEDDGATAVDVLANDTDADSGDALTLASAAVVSGTGTVSIAGTEVSYDPNGTYEYLSVGDTATVRVDYVTTDAAGSPTTGTLTITVNGANDAPTAIDDTASANEDGPPVAIDVLTAGINDSDVDQNDTLSVSAVGIPSAGTATLAGNTVTFDPGTAFTNLAVGETGTATFTYDISDGNGGTDTASVTVTVFGANDVPTPVDDTASVPEDGPGVAVDVLANDVDPDTSDTLAIQGVGDATNGTVAWDGATGITYTPDPAFFQNLAVGETATDSFDYTVVDDHGSIQTATAVVTIEGVNDVPVAVDDTGSVDEDSTVDVDLGANDTDIDDSDVLVVAAVDTASTLGTVTLAGNVATYNPGTAFQYLAVGETATDTFDYTIDDGNGGTDTGTATITVTGVNDGPIAAADTMLTNEDFFATLDVALNDTDTDTTDVLSVSALDTTGTLGSVTRTGNVVRYEPPASMQSLAPGQTATDTYGYTIDDANGGTSNATVTVTIVGVNDNPVVVADTATTDEASTVDIAVTDNDSDIDDGDSIAVDSFDTTGTRGTVTQAGDVLTYDPGTAFRYLAEGETATDVFTYTVIDSFGGTASTTVTVTVTGVNHTPTATDDAIATTENTAVTVDVVAPNDTDPDTSDVLRVDSVDTTGTLGTVTFSGATVTYDPGTAFVHLAQGVTATDTFTYTISDGHGGTATATVTVTITGINAEPIAGDDTLTTAEDSIVTADVVAANDSDADGGDTVTLIEVNTSDTTGEVTFSGNTITYDPNGQFEALAVGETATDTFTYTIEDGQGASVEATVTVTVTGVNDVPEAADDADETDDASPLDLVVIDNDSDPDDSDTLSVNAVDTSQIRGTATFAGGTITYDPTGVWNQIGSSLDMLLFDDETATERFTYTVDDGNGGTAAASVEIVVRGTLSHTADTDGDGVIDWVELVLDTDPNDPDDRPDQTDGDGNGVPDWIEYTTCGEPGCIDIPNTAEACPVDNEKLDLVEGVLELGGSATVEAKDPWAPYSRVEYFVCSLPVHLGTVTGSVDGKARFEADIPVDLEPGTHVLWGIGVDTKGELKVKSIGFTVEEPEPTTTQQTTTTEQTEQTTTTASTTASSTTPTTAAAAGSPTTTAPTAATAAAAQVKGSTQSSAAAATPSSRTGGSTFAPILMGALMMLTGGLALAMARLRRRQRNG